MSITHWLIVLFIVVLLFGARKLPDAAKGVARSLKIFKSEMNDKDHPAAQPREQQPAQQPSDLASWPRLDASNSVPPQATPAGAHQNAEVPTSVPAEPKIVS